MSPIERAEAELKRLEGGGEPAPSEAPAKQVTEPEVKASTESEQPVVSAPEKKVDDVKPEGEDENSLTFKQRWLTLQGAYRKAQEQLGDLQDQNRSLADRIAALEKSSNMGDGISLPETATRQELQEHIDNLAEEYGADFDKAINARINRRVEEILSKRLPQMEQAVGKIERDVEEARELTEKDRKTRFLSELGRLAGGDWEKVLASDEFQNWLAGTFEPFSGDLLRPAVQQGQS
jgi:predicted RNase H-like nuclease (RuvC/YqgF family)